MRSGARDAKMLEAVIGSGRFRCVQPPHVRGDAVTLARQTLTVVVDHVPDVRGGGALSLPLAEAQGLRDRLYLEQDDNATDEASLALAANIGTFHRQVMASPSHHPILITSHPPTAR